MPVRLGSTTAEEFALPKVKEDLSQLILEQKTWYGHRDCLGYCDCTGLKTDMAIVTALTIETDMAIVTALAIKTDMAIMIVLASKPIWLS